MRCPTCEKMLPTRQGMRQHHTKVHGEPLPNRTCVDCGTDFYHAKAQRKFCYDCNHNAGTNNGNWKDAKETAECRLCGGSFEFYPSDKKGVYCPSCVEVSDEFLGDASWEVNDIDRVDRECEQCGEEFEMLKCNVIRGRGRFCSHECLCLALTENNEKNTYNQGWFKARREALERDDHKCQQCGIKASELDRDLDVHHQKPVRDFENPSEAHYPDNLISLCRKCHMIAEWKLRSIRRK